MTLQSLSQSLTNYENHEARSIIRILLEDSFGLSYSDMLTGGIDNLSVSEQQQLNNAINRLQQGEPVQYVTGKTWFCDRFFHVVQGILIPRPETEELCHWIISDEQSYRLENPRLTSLSDQRLPTDILDIGTGSGCIAITLQKEIADSNVTGWDISKEALRLARENAEIQNAHVSFCIQDALYAPYADTGKWDIIVSNPPYICHQESADMDKNVLDYEPALALFVPDCNPLLFYQKIAEYALHALRNSGRLYFEINPLYSSALKDMLSCMGFTAITIRNDAFGKKRMLKCTKR